MALAGTIHDPFSPFPPPPPPKNLFALQYALAAFKKLHAMLPDNVEVIYQIANCHDLLGDFKATVKWFEMLSSLVPNDPGVLAKLGAIHARFDDEVKALHYYQVRGRGGVGGRLPCTERKPWGMVEVRLTAAHVFPCPALPCPALPCPAHAALPMHAFVCPTNAQFSFPIHVRSLIASSPSTWMF